MVKQQKKELKSNAKATSMLLREIPLTYWDSPVCEDRCPQNLYSQPI
jgi:hypothetical protein